MVPFPVQSTTWKLMEDVLEILLGSHGHEGLLSDRSDLDSAFSKTCKELGYTPKELINIKTVLLSFAAIAEVDHYALEEEGDDLNCLVMKIYSQKTVVPQIKSARSFLKQAANHIGTDKWERAVELLDKVNTKTTEAMYFLTQGEDKKFTQEMLEDLVICTKMLTLADYLMETLHDTGHLVPFKEVSPAMKRNIAVHATSHVEELMLILEENDVNLGGLMSTMTNSWDKNNILADLYGGCTQWIALNLTDLEDGKVQVTLPSLGTIPFNHLHGVAHVKIERPEDTTLSLWTIPDSRWCGWGETFILLHIYMHEKVYRTGLEEYSLLTEDTKVLVTIKDKDVVAVAADTTGERKWILAEPVELSSFDELWTAGYIHALAKSVADGNIKSVDYLRLKLENYEDKYSLDDIQKAIQALPAAKRLWIRWPNLPKNMEVQHWKKAADVGAKMDTMFLEDINRDNRPTECTGFEYELGRLATRAKSVFLYEVRYYDFDLFSKGVLQGVKEEGACCEQISWEDSIVHGEDFKIFVDQLGWEIEGGRGVGEWNQIMSVVIKKSNNEDASN